MDWCYTPLHYIVKYIEGYIKVMLEADITLPDNLVFYISLLPISA